MLIKQFDMIEMKFLLHDYLLVPIAEKGVVYR